MNDRGAVNFGDTRSVFFKIELPHRNNAANGGTLSMFMSKLQMKCLVDKTDDDLHKTGNFYSHEFIYLNDPSVDDDETRQVIERANNIVHEQDPDNSEFSANHVSVFTMTGLLPKPCIDMVSFYKKNNTNLVKKKNVQQILFQLE